MEKILQILSVFLLLFLVIRIFARRDQNEFKEYYLFKRIILNGDLQVNQFVQDLANRHLFVLHPSKVVVIDMDSDEVKKQLLNVTGAMGMAVAAIWNRGFIVDGDTQSLVVLDLRSFEIIKTLPEAGYEEGIVLFDTFSNQLFIFNSREKEVMVIDPENLTIKSSLFLPGKPGYAVTDEAGSLYINLIDENLIVEIDAGRGRVSRQFQMGSSLTKQRLALDNRNQLLFAAYNKRLAVFDYKEGRILKTLSIEGEPDMLVFEPPGILVFNSFGSEKVSVVIQIKRDEYKLVQVLQTPGGADHFVMDTQTKKIYLSTAEVGHNRGNLPSKDRVVLVFSNE